MLTWPPESLRLSGHDIRFRLQSRPHASVNQSGIFNLKLLFSLNFGACPSRLNEYCIAITNRSLEILQVFNYNLNKTNQ